MEKGRGWLIWNDNVLVNFLGKKNRKLWKEDDMKLSFEKAAKFHDVA